MNRLLNTAFVALQYLLPRHWLTSLTWSIARIRNPRIKDFLITRFVGMYKVDVDEVKLEVPQGFATFNEFFVRELREDARDVDQDPNSIVSPVDGTVSATGKLRENLILQAKGIDYTLDELLVTDLEEADAFLDGRFATIYLAPYNYHRVHAPFDGELLAARYVPGDLFSVNDATVSLVRGLFRRNERLILRFATARGPMMLIFVGALNVGSITTPWTGEIRPRKTGVADVLDLTARDRAVNRGDLLGWFNMGSTVIVLAPADVDWDAGLAPGDTLRMGEAIGRFAEGAR